MLVHIAVVGRGTEYSYSSCEALPVDRITDVKAIAASGIAFKNIMQRFVTCNHVLYVSVLTHHTITHHTR